MYDTVLLRASISAGLGEDVPPEALRELLESGPPHFIDSVVVRHRQALQEPEIREKLKESTAPVVQVHLLSGLPDEEKEPWMKHLIEEYGIGGVSLHLETITKQRGWPLPEEVGKLLLPLLKRSQL